MPDYSPEGVAEWMGDHGRTAYEAYGEHAGWTMYNGRPMPAWGDLKDDVQSHWTRAALAAIARHVKQIGDA